MLKQHAGKGEDLTMNKAKIAVLVSGGGTNLQALLDAQAAGTLAHGEITLVVSSNEGGQRRHPRADDLTEAVRRSGRL